jgi:hypothetical protein
VSGFCLSAANTFGREKIRLSEQTRTNRDRKLLMYMVRLSAGLRKHIRRVASGARQALKVLY